MRRLTIALGLVVSAFATMGAQAAPPIQHWKQDNGARVYLVEARELPIVDIRIVWDAGSARDSGLPGLARLTNSLLDQGSGEFDADAIALALESAGARLSRGSQRDMAYLHLRSLSEDKALSRAVETISRMLAAPSFSENDLARQRGRMLVGLRAAEQDPGVLAERAFYRTAYGDHPYATPPQGTEEGLRAITRDDVAGFYRDYYTAGNAVVAIVGDIDEQRARALAHVLTASLPEGEAAPPLPSVAMPERTEEITVDFPSTQAHLMLGQPAIARDDPDLHVFYVGNHILGGGGLVSLLTHAMREERGLSYSTSSYFVPSSQPGPFVINTQVQAERADEAVEVLRELLQEFLQEGPTADQLEAAKLNITGSFPLNLDSNSDIVGYVSMIGFYGLPLDYLDTYIEKIEAVEAKDIRRVFQKHLDPERLALIRVGPQAELP